MLKKEKQFRNGRRVTKQRITIFNELKSRRDHPDAEMILKAVRDHMPGISIYTVYRNLNLFEEEGLIDRIATWKGRARYDGNVEPHVHFMCEPCGRITDIEDEKIDMQGIRLKNGGCGKIQKIAVLLRGVCEKCA